MECLLSGCEVFLFKICWLLFCVYGVFFCVCVCTICVQCPQKPERHQSPWNWSYRCLWATMWVLTIEPGFSARAASDFNSRASSIASNPLKNIVLRGTRSHCVAWAGLELAIFTRLFSKSQRSVHFCLLSAGIKGVHRHGWIQVQGLRLALSIEMAWI